MRGSKVAGDVIPCLISVLEAAIWQHSTFLCRQRAAVFTVLACVPVVPGSLTYHTLCQVHV